MTAPRAKQLGITDEIYARMLAAQGDVCAICGNPPKKRRLDVDHDHRTGSIRGLLCFTCNHYLLGKYATAAKLRAAAAYLDAGGAPRQDAPVASELDELALHLRAASRVNFASISNRELQELIRRPSVLDLLETLVNDARQAAKGTAV